MEKKLKERISSENSDRRAGREAEGGMGGEDDDGGQREQENTGTEDINKVDLKE